MTPLRCLIIDDEPIARKIIREHIHDIDFLELEAEAENPTIANNILKSREIDLIFLDIEMPKMTGIDFLKANASNPLIILTTAYPEYALEGYELNVLDYLIKPIGFQRFLKAVNKAVQEDGKTRHHIATADEYFFVKSNNKIERIRYRDVLYIEGMVNYLIIHTVNKKYVAYLTFKSLEKFLPKEDFIRIHKSYTVAVSAIDSIDEHAAHIGKISLPISKYHRKPLMQHINEKLFKR